MMDISEDDIQDEDEHFQDFTTASDWEFFTASLENLLAEWQAKPVESENIHHNWVVLHEKTLFAEFPFKVSYYKSLGSGQESSMGLKFTDCIKPIIGSSGPYLPLYLASPDDIGKEFPPQMAPHILSELFYLKEFGVISSSGAEPILSESRLKVLLSSACIALNNTNSNFPIFIQFHHWNQNYFCGVADSSGIRTSFQMIHLKHVAKQYKYLAGLLELFKSKIGTNLPTPIGLSVHFFYTMNTWHTDYTFESEYLDVLEFLKGIDNQSDSENETEASSWNGYHAFTNLLPFGCSDDPFKSLSFAVGWPSLTENVVVDTQTYSDLDPDQAPDWFFGLKPNSNLDFRLDQMLETFWKLQEENKTIENILGKNLGKGKSSDTQYMSALDKLALGNSPLPVVNQVITNVNRAQKQLLFSPLQYLDLAPIEQGDLDVILLQYLFPDASAKAKYPYPEVFDKLPEFENPELQSFVEGLQGVKSAPMGSLTWRLAIILSYYSNVAGFGGIAHIWAELILELRYRWENSILISGLETGPPNSGTCLLNQKFQMLNCCIGKKLAREKKELENASGSNEPESRMEEDSEEDEFFDCEDDLVDSEGQGTQGRLQKPSGRLKKCGRLRLLKTGEPLYIPLTQDPAPMTEDGFEEQTKMLVELGDDVDGMEKRAKLMSASLASDMQSFKAANPGCILEDFVRWYSPRDWIENENTDEYGNKTGELSIRMKMPGNLWIDVWSMATPVPARRQKRLFDDTKEAENILFWMRGRTLRDISQLIFPCLAHASTLKILEEVDKLTVECKVPSTISQHLTQLTRSLGDDLIRNQSTTSFGTDSATDMDSFINKYDSNTYKIGLLNSLLQVEREVCQIRSFQQKFSEIDLKRILKKESTDNEESKISSSRPYLLPNYIKIEGGYGSPIGQKIRDIFRKEVSIHDLAESVNEFKFGEPMKKVFVLKYIPVYNNKTIGQSSEALLPQRMSCCLKKDEFKVAGTFSMRTDLG